MYVLRTRYANVVDAVKPMYSKLMSCGHATLMTFAYVLRTRNTYGTLPLGANDF